MTKNSKRLNNDLLDALSNAGEMGELTRTFDWSKTPVGPIASWPQSLMTLIRTILCSHYPMFITWGEDYTLFYNDAYAKMTLGAKSPWALGRSFREVWSEIWDPELKLRAEKVVHQGQATWDEGLQLFLERKGFPEETYHTFSYSPIPDDDGTVGGLLCVVNEDTERNISERRLRTLRDLAACSSEAKSVEIACQTAARILTDYPLDVPFAVIYLLDEDGKQAFLAATCGVEPGTPASPAKIDLYDEKSWPFLKVAESGSSEVVSDLVTKFGELPGGPWPEPSPKAVVLPLGMPGQTKLAGFIVTGVSARRPLDDNYRAFFELVAGHVASAIANARALEKERQRAEELTKLDKAKTAFFSNVSHEFRTPLTLILGPIEEMLSKSIEQGAHEDTQLIEVIHRNCLRLQRLVNTLLDFSRIEAGRMQAFFEPTDIAAFTEELTSNFRSSCEKAGLELIVDCPPLSQPSFLDRQMWEKIIFNLLSNAFKFTLEGHISVSIRDVNKAAELRVSDTGIGINENELPHLFERFHRIENVQARTYEGSGIGLAMVQELVKLHGGRITAESEVGRGTTFIVTIPWGINHLPIEQVNTKQSRTVTSKSSPFLKEEIKWLPDLQETEASQLEIVNDNSPHSNPSSLGNSKIVVVDDNADMRQYLLRILSVQYHVKAVANGEDALAMVSANPPDLIISDVMMPKLDGFGLLRELRSNPKTADIPMIMLSARAGEESQLEAMQSIVDEYLVKPFSARILLASVSSHLRMSQLRRESNKAIRESEERFRALINATSDIIYHVNSDWSEMQLIEGRDFKSSNSKPNLTWFEKHILPEDKEEVMNVIQKAIQSKNIFELEHRVVRSDGSHGWTHSRAIPILDQEGKILEWFGVASDVTRRKEAELALLEESRRKDIFLATLAHELRNPLAPIRNGLMIMRLANGDQATFDKIFPMMERQLTQMLRLIDDLLDLSRISRGKIKLHKERIELTRVIHQAIDTNRMIIDQEEHELQIDLPLSPIYVFADVVRLSQVFSNILSNAVKYTDKKGRIHISAQQRKDEIIISVSDNGIGIPASMLPHVFEMFTQVDIERSQGGLGIGLSLVKQIVELHEGTVTVKSEGEGHGTEFIVRLPIVHSEVSTEARFVLKKSISARRILIVDDNHDVAKSLGFLLEFLGHDIKIAYNGSEGIEEATLFKPHLILLDIGMPKLNGYETAKAIRKQRWGKDVVLVALTGWGQNEDRRRSLEAGFDAHMTKPIDIEALQQMLADIK